MTSTTPEQGLPLGVSDFASLRQDGLIYVDKTAMVHQLARSAGSKILLTRPRRFGKSLLVSTFESLFKYGLRDFQGLAIESLWKDTTYNVVRLDFSRAKRFSSSQEFRLRLDSLLTQGFGNLGFTYNPDPLQTTCDQLSEWLSECPKNSLVLLIDEYDAPLTACLDKPELFEQVRDSLSDFYAVLKSNDGALRFLFITGITKYSKVSIFSEMNNLEDIVLDPKYGTLLGYTEEEINRYFGGYVDNAARVLGMTTRELMDAMRSHYDGYCFDEQAATHVYSPWSTLNFLKNPERNLKNYWIESGGQPSLLTSYVRSHSLKDPVQYGNLQSIPLDNLSISADISTLDDVVLLMQAGYLTIKAVEYGTAYLDYPNREVAESMARYYTQVVLKRRNLAQIGAGDIVQCLMKGDVDTFVDRLNKAFLSLDYTQYPITDESRCRALASVFLNGAGLPARSETHNALGRSDLEFTTGETHWVLEFKYAAGKDNPEALLEKALAQMEGRMYGRQAGESLLMRVGLVFSEERRQIVAFRALEPVTF